MGSLDFFALGYFGGVTTQKVEHLLFAQTLSKLTAQPPGGAFLFHPHDSWHDETLRLLDLTDQVQDRTRLKTTLELQAQACLGDIHHPTSPRAGGADPLQRFAGGSLLRIVAFGNA